MLDEALVRERVILSEDSQQRDQNRTIKSGSADSGDLQAKRLSQQMQSGWSLISEEPITKLTTELMAEPK